MEGTFVDCALLQLSCFYSLLKNMMVLCLKPFINKFSRMQSTLKPIFLKMINKFTLFKLSVSINGHVNLI